MTGIGKVTKTITASGTQTIDGLLSGKAWSGTITYAFPTSSGSYTYTGEPDDNFGTISTQQQNAAKFALDIAFGSAANDGFSVEGFTNVAISAGGATDSNLRFAASDTPPTAWAYYPSTGDQGGDLWFGRDFDYTNPVAGNYAWTTMLHEVGHALGLKHGHESEGSFPALPSSTDSMEYSIMTYRSNVGGPVDGYRNEEFGYAQSYMMYDIAALQKMYGADFSTNSGTTVYKWNPNSGDTLVNGQVAIDAGANRIFATIWDGGGNDTYDLSAYTTALSIDLRPGNYSKFSAAQLAKLNFDSNTFARGNIFNAMLFNGDLRSLIENAKGGSGNDTINGNQGVNSLFGNGGVDKLFGFDGNDTLNGGSGNDTLDGGNGNDTLFGGSGADVLKGGAGTDTASYSNATKGVVASLLTPASNTNDAAGDTYSAIENLTGSDFADKLTGNAANNTLKGGGGVDTLTGGAGNDTLNGGASGDKLIGGTGVDTATYVNATTGVTASLTNASINTNEAKGDTYSGIENLFGSAFGDKLTGNTGENKLTGYKGNDTLTGGSGADIFVFAAGYGRDTITDFKNNEDNIDLQSYNFSSVSSVLSKAVTVGDNVEIRLTSADVIVLKNFDKANLDASDFIL